MKKIINTVKCRCDMCERVIAVDAVRWQGEFTRICTMCHTKHFTIQKK